MIKLFRLMANRQFPAQLSATLQPLSRAKSSTPTTASRGPNEPTIGARRNSQSGASKSGKSATGGRVASSSRVTRSQSSRAGLKMEEQQSEAKVKHDKESNRFTLHLGPNKTARIDYKPIGRNKIEMYHTEVPVELRGRGLGKTLAKGALESAAQSKLKVKLTCSYLIDYGNKFADTLVKSIILHD